MPSWPAIRRAVVSQLRGPPRPGRCWRPAGFGSRRLAVGAIAVWCLDARFRQGRCLSVRLRTGFMTTVRAGLAAGHVTGCSGLPTLAHGPAVRGVLLSAGWREYGAYARVAVSRGSYKAGVGGSSPSAPTSRSLGLPLVPLRAHLQGLSAVVEAPRTIGAARQPPLSRHARRSARPLPVRGVLSTRRP
jgi:hypothetical protein